MICDISTNSFIQLSDSNQKAKSKSNSTGKFANSMDKSKNKLEFASKSEYERAFEKEILKEILNDECGNNKFEDSNKKIETSKVNQVSKILQDTKNTKVTENNKSSENNNENKISSPKSYFLTYSFSSEEVCLLAKFLRDKQDELPEGLENLNLSLERAVYNNLTLEEAKRFYS